MATLHLMVGLPCSGKTTRARQIAEEERALLLTPDVWHLKLFGNDIGSDVHDQNHDAIEAIMWDLAEKVLAHGVDVILDFGFWARSERDAFRKKAEQLGCRFRIHYMDVPFDELYRRLEERNQRSKPGVFVITKEEMDRYVKLFQPPSPDELA